MMIGSPSPTVRPAATAPVLSPLLSPVPPPPPPTVGDSDGITLVVVVKPGRLVEVVLTISVVVTGNELEGGMLEVVVIAMAVVILMLIEAVALLVMLRSMI